MLQAKKWCYLIFISIFINFIESVSGQNCHQYQFAVYENRYVQELSLNSNLNQIQIDRCGQIDTNLILGGESAKPREFPHMALIGYAVKKEFENISIQWNCDGSLISENFILTAAHCSYSNVFGYPILIRLGELNYGTNNDDAQPEDFNILQVIIHPNYNANLKYHDIALMKLNRFVKINPYKRPACLPIKNYQPNKLIATGWGIKKLYDSTNSEHLQKVTLENFNEFECNEIFKNLISFNYTYQMCAGSRNEIKDTCQGDSGGPLQIYHSTEYCMYEIIGITSFGILCGKRIPAVYTRVYPYIDWIKKLVWG